MANKERGEVEIVLDGETFIMRPTFEAQCAIEAATGKNLIALTAAVASYNFGIIDLAIIVTEGLKAGGASVNLKSVGPRLVAAGWTSSAVIVPVAEFLNNAVTGGLKPGEA